MIIKKFQGSTESEAIMMAKEEMGNAAIVMNIKTIKHRGFARLVKKDFVEVTAALEDRPITAPIPTKVIAEQIEKKSEVDAFEKETSSASAIEEKLNNLQSILESRMKENTEGLLELAATKESELKKEENSINFKFMQLIYSQLLDNEVDEKYANQIIAEIQSSTKKSGNVDSILAAIYQKIILKIGQPKPIEIEDGKTKVVFFVGSTGVGKTTTIAKLASDFKLNKKVKVALITLDTYRIAAVEQLRTYANILDVPLQAVYTIEEFNMAVRAFSEYDLVLVDTAGRSHKNNEQCDEMLHLINDSLSDENIKKEVYLVLSATTKYKDLIKVNEAFSPIKNYSIIFTKLDETSCLGNIVNMKLKTEVSLSYVTSGQVVPDDISIIDAQKIARSILGSNE